MLGMVQPPQVIPNIQPPATQPPQQSSQPSQQSNIQAARSLAGQVLQDQTLASQTQPPMRKQHQNQPSISMSSTSVSPPSLQSQPMPSHPLQTPQLAKGHPNPQVTPISVPQSSQLPNIPPPLHSASQPQPLHQPQMPTVSTQLQQPLRTTGIAHPPLQPPLPPQARLPSVPSFHHQCGPQMGPNVGFQHSGAQHPLQPMFHSSNKPQASMGSSFSQGQPPLPNQLPPLYQGGGSHLGPEFNNQVGNSMQVDRGPSWISGPPESSARIQLPGPQAMVPGQIGPGSQPTRAAPLTPEMEKALLQQVMSLTPEQINLLPPEQRNQVLQLQQMLRQ
ncbi:pollen-specific leucine-rich repeat extensin-like protein 3 isoform X2 [Hevea brasiliensis]|nr:pollen-specific leucine-rich repeat extensin-like protein 3 isoform X2 [Hevea brasiliensis]